MSTLRSLNRQQAKQRPQEAFDSPLEIVEEILFTKGEKIATLNRWRQGLLDQLNASGAGDCSHGAGSDRTRILEQIETAIGQLR
jgi:hypothetical protein